MTQQKQNGKLIAIITMIFLFGMDFICYQPCCPYGNRTEKSVFSIQRFRDVG